MSELDWLREYYNKAADDKNIDLQRKDSFTNWALVSLLGFFAVFGQFSSLSLPSFAFIGAMTMALALIMRFYAHSCISYANIRKLNTIILAIEKYWMHGKPGIDEIKKLIETHGQQRWSAVGRMKTAWTQLKAGFLIMFSAPILVIVFTLIGSTPNTNPQYQILGISYEYVILIVLVIYMMYEVAIFISYNPLKIKKKS